MTGARYTNASQQRLLRVLLALAGHEVNGRACADIARAVDASMTNVYRDLENLRIAGLAEQMTDSAQWRLTPRIPQIAMAMLSNLDRAEKRTAEIRQRFTREPH